jgi:hypothetical protein
MSALADRTATRSQSKLWRQTQWKRRQRSLAHFGGSKLPLASNAKWAFAMCAAQIGSKTLDNILT